jgi:DNA repair exonuclease SbcCD nuclease subunit
MKQGDKVICVNNKNLQINHFNFDKPLVEGAIYHVREMVPGYDYPGQPEGVKLEEIKGKQHTIECYDGQKRTIEVHFRQNRFRVIEELDINVLEEMRTELITLLNTKE